MHHLVEEMETALRWIAARLKDEAERSDSGRKVYWRELVDEVLEEAQAAVQSLDDSRKKLPKQ